MRVGVRVEAHLVAERLGIERPAFAESLVPAVFPEARQIRLLLGERDLQVVAGHGLVEHQRLHLPPGPRLDGRQVGSEIPRPARGQRARVVRARRPRRRRNAGSVCSFRSFAASTFRASRRAAGTVSGIFWKAVRSGLFAGSSTRSASVWATTLPRVIFGGVTPRRNPSLIAAIVWSTSARAPRRRLTMAS